MCKILAVHIAAILIVSSTALGVTEIRHINPVYDGWEKIDYPEGPSLEVGHALKLPLILKSYSGQWQRGRANGFGKLEVVYLQPQADNPAYIQLNSNDPATKSQALMILDRAKMEATALGRDPEMAVHNILNSQPLDIIYEGMFLNGKADGLGELCWKNRKLRGHFLNWLPEGFVTHLQDDLAIFAETFVHGLPDDGPIFINRYPIGGRHPSSTFVGLSKQETATGVWYNRGWNIVSEKFNQSGFGPQKTISYKDGWIHVADYNPELLAMPLDLREVRGSSPDFSLQVTDPVYQSNPIRCHVIDPEGWRFGYNVVGSFPFGQQHAPPYTCFHPTGKAGTVSFPTKDCPQCEVIFLEDKWGSRIGKNIERIMKDISNVIVSPIDGIGKAATEHICGAAQHEPGKNCNVSASTRVSFGLPDNSNEKQRQQEDLARFLDARQNLEERLTKSGNAELDGLLSILKAGANSDKGLGPDQKLSMLMMEELDHIYKLGFADDLRRVRLASFGDQFVRLFAKYLPVGEFAASLGMGYTTYDRIFETQQYLMNLPGDKKALEIGILLDSLNRLSLGTNPNALLKTLSDGFTVGAGLLIPDIPGITKEKSYELAHSFGFNPEKYFVRYKEFKSADDLVKQLIRSKFEEAGIPPPSFE